MFVVTPSERVAPLQQRCVTRFEEAESIPLEHWFLHSSRLVGYWEITPVSEYLESILEAGIFQVRCREIEAWTVEDLQYVRTSAFDAPQCFVMKV